MTHTRRWTPVCPELNRVQEKAKACPQERFTSLAHLITENALWRSYQKLDANAAPGVDKVNKDAYGETLYKNLEELYKRLKNGQYRASPVLRCWIEKPDGGQRPLGIPTVEDKIVQGAVVEILNSIYEVDFMGFSYGFRPGRSQHHALQALQTFLQKGKVNWVLDADISKFFDTIDHKELMDVLKQRITDRSLLKLIGKWLSVGVVEEDGRRIRTKQGTPQGGVISPLLANIFLHHVVDVFVHEWRKTKAKGEIFIVRYADDFVIGCEYKEDADALLKAIDERLREYGLTLNRNKTRLIRFGRYWQDNEKVGKSETFDYLGLTHFAAKDRKGRYHVKRITTRKRFNRSLKVIAEGCRKHRHLPIAWQWKQLRLKLTGHYNYYGVRGNFAALARFRHEVRKSWLNALKRRGQKVNKDRLYKLIASVFELPTPKITHPEGWLNLNPGYLLGRAGCGNAARPVL